MSFDDQGLVLRRYPGEYLDFVVDEVVGPELDEVIIDGINLFRVVRKDEVVDLPSLLHDASRLVVGELKHLRPASDSVVVAAFDHNDCFVGVDNASHEGSLHSQEYIVAGDDLGVDVGICQHVQGRNRVIFQLVQKGHHSQNSGVFQKCLSLTLEVCLHIILVDLLITKGNAPVTRKGQLFDKLVVTLKPHPGVTMDHLWCTLDVHEITLVLSLPHQHRHRLESRLVLIYLDNLEGSSVNSHLPDHLTVLTAT